MPVDVSRALDGGVLGGAVDVVFYGEDHSRARLTATALEIGMRGYGDNLSLHSLKEYDGKVDGDAAIIFGIRSFARQIVAAYHAAGKSFLIMDKGYTRRKSLGNIEHNNYWRVGVNALHTQFSVKSVLVHSSGRFEKLGIALLPIKKEKEDGYVLILPPARKIFLFLDRGDLKAMKAYFARVAKTVLAVTDKKVRFRGKTEQGRWQFTLEMSDRILSYPSGQTIRQDIAGASVVVTHTTNAGVQAVIAGVPVVELGYGVVKPLTETDLANVGNPRRYTEAERWRFVCWLAWQQWTLAELASGEAWEYLRPQIL